MSRSLPREGGAPHRPGEAFVGWAKEHSDVPTIFVAVGSLLLKNLAPASRRQDHTTSPYALAFSSGVKKRLTPKRPPHSDPTHRDDRETPLVRAGMAGVIILISRIVKQNIFDSVA